MIAVRHIPILLLEDQSLVKTSQFKNPIYVGDPYNVGIMFNDLIVDELSILNINISKKNLDIDYNLLKKIAKNCFMPMSYGGGIDTIEKAINVIQCGFEKVIINSASINNKNFITNLAKKIGSQSVIVSIDYKYNKFNQRNVYMHSGKIKTDLDPLNWCKEVESLGAGEILLTSINHEGMMNGFDLEFIKKISNELNIPIIANGGAGSIKDIENLINNTNVSAVGFSSIALFNNKSKNVLINYPKFQNEQKK